MEDIIVRSRYSRNNKSSYKRKKANRQYNNRLGKAIKIQLLVVLLLFIIILGMLKIDTSITKSIMVGVRWMLSSHIDLNVFYTKIGDVLNPENWGKDKDIDDLKNIYSTNNDIENTYMERDTEYTEHDSDLVGHNSECAGQASESTELLPETINATDNNNPNLEFMVPVEGVVISYFGEKLDPVTNKPKYHTGIDIETNANSYVRAAEDGEVIEISEDRIYGEYIKIKHSGDMLTIYAHCTNVIVSEGEKVDKGKIIAETEGIGVSPCSHLHFEIWSKEGARNPLEYIKIPTATSNSNEIL